MRAKLLLICLLICALPAAALATPGLQVVDCMESQPGSHIWTFTFFACLGDFSANDLHIEMVDEGGVPLPGVEVMSCTVPDLPGYSCSVDDDTTVSYFFPTVGPYSCVPGLADQYLTVTMYTEYEPTMARETWTMDGVPIASFNTSFVCVPVATGSSSWGTVKSLY